MTPKFRILCYVCTNAMGHSAGANETLDMLGEMLDSFGQDLSTKAIEILLQTNWIKIYCGAYDVVKLGLLWHQEVSELELTLLTRRIKGNIQKDLNIHVVVSKSNIAIKYKRLQTWSSFLG